MKNRISVKVIWRKKQKVFTNCHKTQTKKLKNICTLKYFNSSIFKEQLLGMSHVCAKTKHLPYFDAS